MAKTRKQSQPGRLRIVAGIWRSRLLQIADAPGLRPTPERIRETLFNWLADDVPDATCLDLCAGTGALGLEALSRGAARAVFVESSASVARVLQRNIDALEAHNAEVHVTDARDFPDANPGVRFDIVFLDPPFAAAMLEELCRLLAERRMVADGAHVYLEMSADEAPPSLPDLWVVSKNKTAGNVRFMLVRVAGGEQQ